MSTTATTEQLRCSFCSKPQTEVKKIIAGPGVYICDECVGLCNETLAVDGPLQIVHELSEQSEDQLVDILVRIRDLHAGVDDTARSVIRELRSRHAASWAKIGEALGMTRQSAWERFSGED